MRIAPSVLLLPILACAGPDSVEPEPEPGPHPQVLVSPNGVTIGIGTNILTMQAVAVNFTAPGWNWSSSDPTFSPSALPALRHSS